ncbi:MAG: acyl carrier protein [Pseudonocardiales bacterium]|jgi:acyl carrier protein|nr:acyl carrier protein [Pseudonocardiales bacterium]
MGNSQAEVEQTIRTFLERANKGADELEPETSLYAEGLGLDSLETAELSATLEDEHGTDPFSGGPMPQTVGDILAFYAVPSAQS